MGDAMARCWSDLLRFLRAKDHETSGPVNVDFCKSLASDGCLQHEPSGTEDLPCPGEVPRALLSDQRILLGATHPLPHSLPPSGGR